MDRIVILAFFVLCLCALPIAQSWKTLIQTRTYSTIKRLSRFNMIRGLKDEEFHKLIGGKSTGSVNPTVSIPKKKQTKTDTLSSETTDPIKNDDSISKDNVEETEGKKSKKKKKAVVENRGTPFSRIVKIEQIPLRKSVVCRLQANEAERLNVADQLHIIGVQRLAANVTLSWIDEEQTGVLVKGTIRARIVDALSSIESLLLSGSDDADPKSTSSSIDENDSSIDRTIQFDFSALNEDDFSLIRTKFESRLLYNPSSSSSGSNGVMNNSNTGSSNKKKTKRVKFEERTLDFNLMEDYDDEIPASGQIDIGAIVLQYLMLEVGW